MLKLTSFFAFVFVIIFAAVGLDAQTVDCGCETAPLPAVWAKLNGKPISEADLDKTVLSQIADMQSDVVGYRKGQLNVLINQHLLELEAAKLKVTTDQLMQTEVVSKTKIPTDADAETYFNTNKASIEEQAGKALTFAEVKDAVKKFLLGQNEGERAKVYSDQLKAAYGAKQLVDQAPIPKTAFDRQKILATIGTFTIRSEDVEKSLRPATFNTQTSVYNARRDAVDMFVNDNLLTAEATKRGIAPTAVLAAEIDAKLPAITDDMAQKFYTDNKARLNGDFTQLKPQIVDYLQGQEHQRLEKAFADKLRAAAQIEYLLPPPVPPTYAIDLANRPTMGPATAPVTIAAFVDFQCPTCAAFHDTLLRVVRESNGRVRLVFLNYPLDQHKDARKAAEAAEAAREQNKFWEYADLLYKNQSDLSVAHLKALATSLGLDRAKFDTSLDSGKFAGLVDQQERAADTIGVNATPTIFINGRPTDAYDYAALKKAIDTAKP